MTTALPRLHTKAMQRDALSTPSACCTCMCKRSHPLRSHSELQWPGSTSTVRLADASAKSLRLVRATARTTAVQLGQTLLVAKTVLTASAYAAARAEAKAEP